MSWSVLPTVSSPAYLLLLVSPIFVHTPLLIPTVPTVLAYSTHNTEYPLASLPLGYVEASGRPYGIQAIVKANEEHKMIEFMSLWQKLIPERRVLA
jgi:Asp-tRNA(Asn)/Glu-tRNA(Gln) amidotransferase A subunit family amidase